MRRLAVAAFLSACMAACAGGASSPTPTASGPVAAVATEAAAPGTGALTPARTLKDVTYCSAGGVELKMDVYYPQRPSASLPPLVMYVHGGGFVGGDKGTGAGFTDVPEMLGRGYVVAAINYRLAPAFPFPAAIEDVKCAVRSLRANASRYDIDPEHIGVWGGSAGGNLVSLLGVTDSGAGLEGDGGYAGVSSRVSAVVDMFGPTDLRPPVVRALVGGYLPLSGGDDLAAMASPVTFVTADDPPFLILHGEKDPVVPVRESRVLYGRLQDAGVPSQFVIVTNAGHGFVPAGGRIEPSRAEISRMVGDFFDRYLKKH